MCNTSNLTTDLLFTNKFTNCPYYPEENLIDCYTLSCMHKISGKAVRLSIPTDLKTTPTHCRVCRSRITSVNKDEQYGRLVAITLALLKRQESENQENLEDTFNGLSVSSEPVEKKEEKGLSTSLSTDTSTFPGIATQFVIEKANSSQKVLKAVSDSSLIKQISLTFKSGKLDEIQCLFRSSLFDSLISRFFKAHFKDKCTSRNSYQGDRIIEIYELVLKKTSDLANFFPLLKKWGHTFPAELGDMASKMPTDEDIFDLEV